MEGNRIKLQENLRERSSAQAGSELQEGFEKMEMKRKLTTLRKALPKMSAVEHYLEQLQEWLRSSDAYVSASFIANFDNCRHLTL